MQVTDGAFPQIMLQQITDEARTLEAAMQSAESRSGRHGFWIDLEHKRDGSKRASGEARFAIEQAIERMVEFDYAFEERSIIAGAEWWVQKRTSNTGLHFHYDKDEVLAGTGRLICPLESSITYLTDGAIPTIIVNRTTPDGNGADPMIPRRAVIAYPKRNRHLVFRGNLMHGVPEGGHIVE